MSQDRYLPHEPISTNKIVSIRQRHGGYSWFVESLQINISLFIRNNSEKEKLFL